MAANAPLSPGRAHPELKLPMPPPLLHTRSGNEYERPSTPTSNSFITPQQTPQGSPSKHYLPPGAKELPNVFENAMRLEPGTPTRQGKAQLGVGSPNKAGRLPPEEGTPESSGTAPNSPLKRGQENTPPNGRPGKDNVSVGTPAHAAVSRQEQYEATAKRLNPLKVLTPEELEKASLPKVKRLANVTQICMCRCFWVKRELIDNLQTFSITTLTYSTTFINAIFGARTSILHIRNQTQNPPNTMPQRQNTLVVSERTYARGEQGCVMETFRSLRRLAKEDTVPSILPRKKTLTRFAL